MAGPSPQPEPGAATLLSDVVNGFGRLVQGELRLARAEATEGMRAAGAGLAKIAAAAVVAITGLNVLAGAAVAALAKTGIGPAWSALILGVVLCLLAWGLLAMGRTALRLNGLWPDRALQGLRRDAEAVHAGLTEKGMQDV